VADVARQLLAEMLPGVTRDTPEPQRRLVVRYLALTQAEEKRGLVREMLRERPPPYALLLDVLEWEKTPAAQVVIVQGMLDQTPAVLSSCLEAGDPALYERLLQWSLRLEMTAAIPRVAVYAWRNGKLEALRAQAANLLATNDRPYLRRLLAELHLLADAPEAALATAATLDDSAYRQELFARTGRWAELAAELSREMGQPNGPKLIQLAAAQRLAGQDQEAVATLARLAGEKRKPAGPDGDDDDDDDDEGGDVIWLDQQIEGMGGRFHPGMIRPLQVPPLFSGGRRQVAAGAWTYLLAYGLVGDSLGELQRRKDAVTATALLVQQYRYVEADRLLREALAATPSDLLLRVRRAGILQALGDPKAADPVRELLDACRRGEPEMADDGVFLNVLDAMRLEGFQQEIAAVLPDLLGRFTGPREDLLQNVAQYLAPEHSRLLNYWFWWEQLVRDNPGEAMADRAARVRDFLAGQLDAAETERILRLPLRPEVGLDKQMVGLQQVGLTCLYLGRTEEAIAACRLAVRMGNEAEEKPKSRLAQVRRVLGDVLLDCAQWTEAAEEHGALWLENRVLRSLLFHGLGLAWGGRSEAAAEVFARVLKLHDPASPGWLFLFLDPEEFPEANRELLLLTERVARAVPAEALPAARRLGDAELERRLARRQWYEAVVSPAGKTPGALLQINADLAFAECRARLATDGAAATLAAAKRVSDAFPFDVDGAADTVEALDRAGFAPEADDLTAHVLAREQAILDKLPAASQHLNGYAWMCARTGRNLESGETYVRRALEQMPDNDAYLDTLAVILHRRGDLDGAVAAMRTCLRLKPHDHHYRWQLAKWLSEAERKP
ncbi:MAG: hypothetical protein RBU25_14135, partial [Lentisphaeria bacterium]|jgi:hypothetical protein|nr:hypothetical protein [Lentisphaeria bacterium]